jgi:two-component system KDP operon response regulator KdpE
VSGPAPVVLVVEDEPAMQRFLRASLSSHGYQPIEAGTVAEATMLATTRNPDLVLLDLGLPDGDGIDVVRTIRGWSEKPIIVISARGREEDKVLALDAGANDYLTKPFGVNELLARMRVAMRSLQRGADDEPMLTFGTLSIDLARRIVKKGETEIHLTPIEYKLLAYLARNAGRVITYRQILKEVWGPNAVEQTHYVRVHMAELRRKVEDEPARPKLLMTEPGVGYRLRDPAA